MHDRVWGVAITGDAIRSAESRSRAKPCVQLIELGALTRTQQHSRRWRRSMRCEL